MYTKKKLAEKVYRLKELEIQQDKTEREIEKIRNQIKHDMDQRDVEELTGDDWKISYKTVYSSRFDSVGLKEHNPELYETFKVPVEYRRLSVK